MLNMLVKHVVLVAEETSVQNCRKQHRGAGLQALEKIDYYIQLSTQLAPDNDPNLERNTKLSLNLNLVLQGYTDLLIKPRAEGQEKSITSCFQPSLSSSG